MSKSITGTDSTCTSNPSMCARVDLTSDKSEVGLTNSTGWEIRTPMLIGRENADIILGLHTLSRRHALLTPELGYCSLQDLRSRNGTFLNGELLDNQIHPLKHGDIIVLAGAIELFFTDPMATPIAPRIGKLDGVWVNADTHDVWINARLLTPALSTKQFKLLQLINDANGSLVTRDEIVRVVWPDSSPDGISEDAVDSVIKRLRKRLSEIEADAPIIEVLRGQGIRLAMKV